jgi:hypothetical protein
VSDFKTNLITHDYLLIALRFGIEFAPEVVQADGNVRNLAWRICNAKKILVSSTVLRRILAVHVANIVSPRLHTVCPQAVAETRPLYTSATLAAVRAPLSNRQ